jgi:hypothetical protein
MAKVLGTAKSALMYVLLAMFVLLVTAGRVQAQAQTATISGTVTDASGAVLAGAKVEAVNVATTTTRSTTSDDQGRYKMAQLEVGTYNVQASMSGFQTVVHQGVTLAIGSSVIVDLSLPVGQVTQTVNVEAQVSRVETTTSEVSTLVNPQQMRDLPLNGRNFEQLLTVAPGVVTVPKATNLANFVVGRLYGAMDNYSVAGSRPTGQMFLLDNTDIRDFWEHATGSGYAGTSLGVEAIGEFQVLTNTYTAQFAGNGVVMNATSRSGTNDWHGGAYEFFRNNKLDAASLGDKNAATVAANLTPAVNLSAPPPFRRNQFGGALGGPIKKDKLFFFANYEGLRESLSSSIAPVYMPTSNVMNGQLPCSFLPAGTAGCPDPSVLTGPHPDPTTNPYVDVPAFGGGSIPQAVENLDHMINIMKLYALCKTCASQTAVPGYDPLDLGGYYVTAETPTLKTNENYVMGRVDYNYSSKDSIFGRYTFDNAHVNDIRDPMGIFPEDDYSRNQFVTITERHIVSPTMLNSLRFSYTRVKEASFSQPHLTPAELQAANLTGPVFGSAACPNTDYVPTCDPLNFVAAAVAAGASYPEAAVRSDGTVGGSVSPIAGIGFPNLGPDADRPDSIVQSKFSGGDDLTWTKGAHSFQIGGVVTRVQTSNFQLAYANGQSILSFNPAFSAISNFPSLPFPLGNFSYQVGFFQATPSWEYTVPPGATSSIRYFREIMMAPYLQDSWKVTPKLTLNLGIRYDYVTNPVGFAGGGQSLHTIVGSYLPPIGPQFTVPDCSGIDQSVSTADFATCQLGVFTPVKHVFANNINAANWSPRFGFAYDPFSDHKTSIRGGFGVFHDPVAARIYESGFIGTPPAASVQMQGLFGAGSHVGLPCFPDPYAVIPGYCGWLNPTPGEFAAVDYRAPNGSPYLMQFNLNVQRQLAAGTVLSVAYVGSLGRHMWMQRDINPVKCSTFPDCSAIPSVTAPNTGACFAVACGNTNLVPGSTTVIENINPALGSRVTEATTSSSSYSSLQVSLNRQFARGLAGQVNYTWSHCIDNGSFATSLEQWGQLMTDAYNQRYDYGNCNFDVRHNLSANALYTLPFKGNRLVEGWQFSTIVSLSTGTPLNVANTAFPSDPSGLTEQWGTRPNYSMAAGCAPDKLVKKYVNTSLSPSYSYWTYQWFDSSCYVTQDPGRLGNVRRNSLQGPHVFNQDFSILKNTKITERLNVQFRAEFFNILNHYNPAPPNSVLGSFVGTSLTPTGFSGGQATTPREIQFALKLDF